MKTKKHVLPFVCVLALSFLASKPFFDRNGEALNLSRSNQTANLPSQLDGDDDGWSFIRYKIFFAPEKPTEEFAKQEDILAYYGE